MEWYSTFKKMIAFLAALIMQSFFVFPVQADHETPVHDRSFYIVPSIMIWRLNHGWNIRMAGFSSLSR
jgi:hypothetical protein